MCPNRCEWTVIISRLSRDRMERIKRWAENGKLCQMIMPYPKDVKDDLQIKRQYEKECDRAREEKSYTRDTREKLKEKYPFKDLRYDWCANNRGSKRDLCYCNWHINNDLTLQFETAWSPVLNVFQKLSQKYKCTVYYEFSEPGCWFSGRYVYIDWRLDESENFNDPWFGEWVECKICHNHYDGRCEDDWGDMTNHICLECYENQWT